MPRSNTYGYQIEFKNNKWVYSDTNESATKIRECKHCGKLPTNEGYDGCLGYLPDVAHACCGHGIDKPYVKFNDGEVRWYENREELLKDFSNI